MDSKHVCTNNTNSTSSSSGTGSFDFAYEDKPVIYLYPQTTTEINVKLNLGTKIKLTATYPDYNSTQGWNIIANPNGELKNLADNTKHNYLFWEGENLEPLNFDLTKGDVVKGGEIKEYLMKTLPKFGLKPNEYNDFIVYWYPRLLKYNLLQIYFAGEEYTNSAKLEVSPKPDSILRLFMVALPLDSEKKLTPQKIQPFKREGFTVVEWGGSLGIDRNSKFE